MCWVLGLRYLLAIFSNSLFSLFELSSLSLRVQEPQPRLVWPQVALESEEVTQDDASFEDKAFKLLNPLFKVQIIAVDHDIKQNKLSG